MSTLAPASSPKSPTDQRLDLLVGSRFGQDDLKTSDLAAPIPMLPSLPFASMPLAPPAQTSAQTGALKFDATAAVPAPNAGPEQDPVSVQPPMPNRGEAADRVAPSSTRNHMNIFNNNEYNHNTLTNSDAEASAVAKGGSRLSLPNPEPKPQPLFAASLPTSRRSAPVGYAPTQYLPGPPVPSAQNGAADLSAPPPTAPPSPFPQSVTPGLGLPGLPNTATHQTQAPRPDPITVLPKAHKTTVPPSVTIPQGELSLPPARAAQPFVNTSFFQPVAVKAPASGPVLAAPALPQSPAAQQLVELQPLALAPAQSVALLNPAAPPPAEGEPGPFTTGAARPPPLASKQAPAPSTAALTQTNTAPRPEQSSARDLAIPPTAALTLPPVAPAAGPRNPVQTGSAPRVTPSGDAAPAPASDQLLPEPARLAPAEPSAGLNVAPPGKPSQLAALTQGLPPHQLGPILVELGKSGAPGPVEITLAPQELGKVHLHFTPDGDALRITLSAERPETLDLFRRGADSLIADLRQAGFSGASLSFSQWGQGPAPAPQPIPARLWHDENAKPDLPTQDPPSQMPPAHSGLYLRL